MITSAAVSPDSDIVATGVYQKGIELWRISTGELIRSWNIDGVEALAFDSNGGVLASISASGDSRELNLWNPATGALSKRLYTASVLRMNGFAPGPSVALAFSPKGTFLASTFLASWDDQTILVWDLSREGSPRSFRSTGCFSPAPALAFNRESDRLASTCGANVTIWSLATGEKKLTLPGHGDSITGVAFSDDGQLLASGGVNHTIRVWDLATASVMRTLTGEMETVSNLVFARGDQRLASISDDGIVRIWDVSGGQQVASLLSMQGTKEWLVAANSGDFDGSKEAWPLAMWRLGGHTFNLMPLEAYFYEHYRPGLLSDVISGNELPRTDISQLARTPPKVSLRVFPKEAPADLPENVKKALGSLQISTLTGSATSVEREIQVEVQIQAPLGQNTVRGVRLFRNGLLVRVWPDEIFVRNGETITLSAPVTIAAGENRLSAYAFNRDNVKSNDAVVKVDGSKELARKGIAYILAVGIDEYSNSDFNLKYAVSDAQSVADALELEQGRLEQFSEVRVVSLSNEQATKENLLTALRQLSSRDKLDRPPKAPAQIASLEPAQPEDALFIYFAGHGLADGDRFFMVPYDLGFTGSREKIDSVALSGIETRSISDRELEQSLAPIDAGAIILVIDACNSGQALDAKEVRLGPMNSEGLAQLAYDKGMFILAASQGYQPALESSRLGHGLLTYALVEAGLKQGRAASEGGAIYIRNWLDFAGQEVPSLATAWLSAEDPKRGFTTYETYSVQRPRVFYPRELSTADEFVIRRGTWSKK